MKPVLEIDKDKLLITTTLTQKMSKNEIYEFMDELYQLLKENEQTNDQYTLLSDSSDKSYADLDSAFELADNFRKLLATEHIKKFAHFSPENDYYSENEKDYPEKFKTFVDKKAAKEWLLN